MFAALGDETRLTLMTRLSKGRRCSISQLTEGTRLTRQAITKHLRVLEKAGVVHATRAGRDGRKGFGRRGDAGRESVFEFDPRPVVEARSYLDRVSRQWDEVLERLRAYVE